MTARASATWICGATGVSGKVGNAGVAVPASFRLEVEAAEEHPANRAEPPRIKPRLESRMDAPRTIKQQGALVS
ncbi:hypothetical protein D3C80_988670 [compost metagenome]